MSAVGVERTTAPVRGGARRGALAVVLLASTLTVMAGAVIAPVVALIRDDLGLTDTAAGLVLTAHGLAIAVASPLVGRAIDRWGVRGPLAAGLLAYGAAGGAGAVLDGYAALIASRLVFGVGAAVVFTATTVAVLRGYRGRARDRAMGWRSAAISVGGLVWPLTGGALGALSWHAPFAVYLVGIPLAAGVLLTVGPDPQPSAPERRPEQDPSARVESPRPEPHGGRLPSAPGGSPRPAPDGGSLTLLRAHPALLRCYVLQGVSALLLYVMLVFAPLRLAELGAPAPLLAAACNCALSGVMALAGLAYARLRGRSRGDDTLVRAALATWTAAFAIAAAVASPIGLIGAAALFGLGMGLAVPTLTVMVAERAPAGRLGQATSLSATATFLVQPLSPLLFGPLVQATSIPTGFLVAAAVAVASLALALPVRRPRPVR